MHKLKVTGENYSLSRALVLEFVLKKDVLGKLNKNGYKR
jgi:hypothetical protein